MIQFNELRVSQDGKCLVLDVQIIDDPCYANIYLDTIIIDVLTSNVCQNNGSHTAVYDDNNEDMFYIHFDEDVKHYRKVFDIDGIDPKMFMINVTARGDIDTEVEGCTSCCYQKDRSVTGFVYNKYPIYQSIMPLLNSIGGCEPSRELIDKLLQLQAFNLAANTGNFCLALDYWNLFYDVDANKKDCAKPPKPCGCHGRA